LRREPLVGFVAVVIPGLEGDHVEAEVLVQIPDDACLQGTELRDAMSVFAEQHDAPRADRSSQRGEIIDGIADWLDRHPVQLRGLDRARRRARTHRRRKRVARGRCAPDA
jgi:hypothetical protein